VRGERIGAEPVGPRRRFRRAQAVPRVYLLGAQHLLGAKRVPRGPWRQRLAFRPGHIDPAGLHGIPPSRRATTKTALTPAAGRTTPTYCAAQALARPGPDTCRLLIAGQPAGRGPGWADGPNGRPDARSGGLGAHPPRRRPAARTRRRGGPRRGHRTASVPRGRRGTAPSGPRRPPPPRPTPPAHGRAA